MKRTADVVIIGGGVTGCSIAFHLAQRGVRDVVVLERRILASGGTGRSVGIMRQLYPTPETSRMVTGPLTASAWMRPPALVTSIEPFTVPASSGPGGTVLAVEID